MSDRGKTSRLGLLALAVPASAALVYALGHLTWYLGTPLGRVPVLDERENIDLALAIAGGTVEHAPFYRAPGYALLLALVRMGGVPAPALFPAALLLGALLHAANTFLVTRISGRWFGPGAGLAAGLLFGLDPVMVHFATQALDATLSLTLFLAGLNLLLRAVATREDSRGWAGASLLWAAAGAVRPNFLLPWAALWPAAIALPGRRLRRLAASLAGVLVLGAMALWQAGACGSAGVLPWQGPYNLWAANRPGANGRYYTQRISLPPEVARANPARAESVILYQVDHNGRSAGIGEMNAYWRAKFLDEVTAHPGRWAALMLRKAYALLNNFEQYNNKTFGFHKALSPWLWWNPICWGLLLILGVAGAARLATEKPLEAAVLAWAAASVALSVVLFFVSARFRLPLAAMLAALAGGCVGSGPCWESWGRSARLGVCAAAVAAAFLAFSNAAGVADTSTFVQDHALLARAAYTVGDDRLALSEAEQALKLQPWHPDALAIAEAARRELSRKPDSP